MAAMPQEGIFINKDNKSKEGWVKYKYNTWTGTRGTTVSEGCRHFSHVEPGADLLTFSFLFVMPTVTRIGMATQTAY